jgi:NADH-quinone oxidoreductase subunit F
VIDAVAAGRRAAIAIDKYLRGDTSRVEIYDLRRKNGNGHGELPGEDGEEDWETRPRVEMAKLNVEERKCTFWEIELGFSEELAKVEAKRCLRCDLER